VIGWVKKMLQEGLHSTIMLFLADKCYKLRKKGLQLVDVLLQLEDEHITLILLQGQSLLLRLNDMHMGEYKLR
jgi:hypothetical protein